MERIVYNQISLNLMASPTVQIIWPRNHTTLISSRGSYVFNLAMGNLYISRDRRRELHPKEDILSRNIRNTVCATRTVVLVVKRTNNDSNGSPMKIPNCSWLPSLGVLAYKSWSTAEALGMETKALFTLSSSASSCLEGLPIEYAELQLLSPLSWPYYYVPWYCHPVYLHSMQVSDEEGLDRCHPSGLLAMTIVVERGSIQIRDSTDYGFCKRLLLLQKAGFCRLETTAFTSQGERCVLKCKQSLFSQILGYQHMPDR